MANKHTMRQAYKAMNTPRPVPRYVPHQLGANEWAILDTKEKRHIATEFTSQSEAREYIKAMEEQIKYIVDQFPGTL